MSSPSKKEPVRALIAVPMCNGPAVVVATDSQWLAYECESIAPGCEDLGMYAPKEPGVYLWTGTAGATTYQTTDGGDEPETEYEGSVRPVRSDELAALLAMEPPEEA